MGVLDDDLRRPRLAGTPDRGERFVGHDFAEFRVIRMRAPRLVPMGDAGTALDIDADEDLHETAPVSISIGLVRCPVERCERRKPEGADAHPRYRPWAPGCHPGVTCTRHRTLRVFP